jgi:hypothetical protein
MAFFGGIWISPSDNGGHYKSRKKKSTESAIRNRSFVEDTTKLEEIS